MAREGIDSKVSQLLDLVMLAMMWLHHHDLQFGSTLADKLYKLGSEDDPLGRYMLLHALQFKALVADDGGDLDTAFDLYGKAAAMAAPDNFSHYIDTTSMIRIRFKQGNHHHAYELLGRGVIEAMDSHTQPDLVARQLGLARLGDPVIAGTVPVFMEALRRFGVDVLQNQDVSLVDTWSRSPEEAIELLRAYAEEYQATQADGKAPGSGGQSGGS